MTMQHAQAEPGQPGTANRRRAGFWGTVAAGAALLISFVPAATPAAVAPRAEASGTTHWVVGTPTQATLDGSLFWPVYFPVTYGTNQRMLGLFDYRNLGAEEAIIAARSN